MRYEAMKRIGKIRVSRKFLDEEESMKFFEWFGMTPIDAKSDFMTGTNTIIGYSRHFDEMPEGSIFPEYIGIFNRLESGDLEFSVKKIDEYETKDLGW